MNNLIVTFSHEEPWENWRARETPANPQAALCSDGFAEYVGVPPDCTQFDAVFTVEESRQGGSFKLIPQTSDRDANLNTESNTGMYSSALELINHMHERGYRYVHVEY